MTGRRLAALLGAHSCSRGAAAGTDPLDQAGLQRQAETLQSTAGEGALMAATLEDDGLTGPYQRVHADELAAAARTQAATLRERGGTAGTRPDVERLAQAAADDGAAASTSSPRPIAGRRRPPCTSQLERAAATAAELAGA